MPGGFNLFWLGYLRQPVEKQGDPQWLIDKQGQVPWQLVNELGVGGECHWLLCIATMYPLGSSKVPPGARISLIENHCYMQK